MKTKYETRALSGIELRDATEGSPFVATLTGYAASFNSDSKPIYNEQRKRPFIERIAPGAFAQSLAEDRNGDEPLSFWSHDETQPLGRLGRNLKLYEDERGLKFELEVPDTTTGRDLVANVRAGVVGGVSFGFKAEKESVVRGAEFDTRTLLQVKLYEVSPTAIPAYNSTSIDFRSHDRLCEQGSDVRGITIDAGAESLERDEAAPPAAEPFSIPSLWAARFGVR